MSVAATKRIQKEISALSKSEVTKANGLLVKLADDNLFRWHVAFGRFPEDTPLQKDMQKYAATQGNPDYVLLEVNFPTTYPDEPPFVRVVSPRIKFHTGHVTIGGSICIQLLVNTGDKDGWQPDVTMEGVLLTVRQLLIDGGARIDFHAASIPYTMEEAEKAFVRVASQHGWTQKQHTAIATSKPVPTPTATPPVPYDFAVEFPSNWKMGQSKILEVVELPAYDPKDNGEGTKLHNEAKEVVDHFQKSWTGGRSQMYKPHVVRVLRIQNKITYASYYQKKMKMNYMNMGVVNERWLYHGTKSQYRDAIIEHGFDSRLAQSGYLGAGIYCTDSSALADSFTSGPEKIVFFGRVLLGEVHSLEASPVNVRTGARTGETRTFFHHGEQRQINTTYDSHGSLYPGHECFYWSIFSNEQAYPDYVLHYRIV